MASKTRDRLIEVARQLFARKGVENTTMLDIANASENKREIHQAVIERESEQIVSRQRQILDSDTSATGKLIDFMRARLEIVKCPTGRFLSENVADMLRLDFKRAEKTRRLAAKKEVEILREILREGVEAGEFSPSQARRAGALIVVVMQGFDHSAVTAGLELSGFDRTDSEEAVIAFIVNGLRQN